MEEAGGAGVHAPPNSILSKFSGGAPPPNPLPGLRPWTPLGAAPPDPCRSSLGGASAASVARCDLRYMLASLACATPQAGCTPHYFGASSMPDDNTMITPVQNSRISTAHAIQHQLLIRLLVFTICSFEFSGHFPFCRLHYSPVFVSSLTLIASCLRGRGAA